MAIILPASEANIIHEFKGPSNSAIRMIISGIKPYKDSDSITLILRLIIKIRPDLGIWSNPDPVSTFKIKIPLKSNISFNIYRYMVKGKFY